MTNKKQFSILAKLGIMFVVISIPAFVYVALTTFGDTTINKTITTNPSLSDGLVGHWTFDGKDLNPNARDISGQGNHGNLTGFTSTTTAPGKIGQALEFDGVDDYVDVSYNETLNVQNNVTVSAWVKANSLTGRRGVYSERYNAITNGTFMLEIGTGNGGSNRVAVTTNGVWNAETANNAIGIGSWYNIVYTRSGSTQAIYVNGISQSLITSNPQPLSTVAASRLIGIQHVIPNGLTGLFDGRIDDVRIYNRALSPTEITRLYQLGATTRINTTITTNPSLSDGLVGHWTFDGKDLNPNARDISGQGNHGNLTGFTSTTTAPGKIGQALSFDGVNDYVDVGTNVFATGSQPRTFTAWVYPKSVTGVHFIFSLGTNTIGRRWSVRLHNANPRIEIEGSGYSTSGIPVTINAWSFIAVTLNGTTLANHTLYRNGIVEQATGATTVDTSATYANIGETTDDHSLGTWAFNGLMDDVRIYNRALSPSEITRLYQLGR